MNGGLRKRVHSYLNVPSTTVNDGRLSFKARGILAYLLDKPAGWDVRSVAIAADSPDGKAAVQAGLRELARAGYYRIERRRLLDGRLVTGTAVSEEPVASWAAEYAEYQGPVPVIQQPDGRFRVQHKDGSLTADGFTDSPGPEPCAPEPAGDCPPGADSEGSVSAGRTGTQFSGAGSAGAGKPGAFTNTEEPLHRTSPLPPPPGPLSPAAVAGAGEGEYDEDQDAAPGLDTLVAEVRAIRPEWSSASIRRALAHPDVAERGWDRAHLAMLAVAADPQSRQPGRLSHDGPWWNQPASGAALAPRPPWCGADDCDERTRRIELAGGADGGRCTRCHPLAAGGGRGTGRTAVALSGGSLTQTAVSDMPGPGGSACGSQVPGAQLALARAGASARPGGPGLWAGGASADGGCGLGGRPRGRGPGHTWASAARDRSGSRCSQRRQARRKTSISLPREVRSAWASAYSPGSGRNVRAGCRCWLGMIKIIS